MVEATSTKRFKVVDPRTESDVFAGELPLESLTTVYPMAPVKDGKPFDSLDLYESVFARTVTPTRGHGVYKIVRTR